MSGDWECVDNKFFDHYFKKDFGSATGIVRELNNSYTWDIWHPSLGYITCGLSKSEIGAKTACQTVVELPEFAALIKACNDLEVANERLKAAEDMLSKCQRELMTAGGLKDG